MTGTSPSDEIPWYQLVHSPLPPRTRVARFAPRLSYGRHWGEPLYPLREAAVAALLYPAESAWYLVLIARPSRATRHAGQVSFPGGAVEAGEGSQQAMLRELEEEVGVHASQLEVLRSLSPVNVYASGFRMQPWLCRATEPIKFVPDLQEVAQVIEVPAVQLIDPRAWGRHRVRRGGLEFTAPALFCREWPIWGATAIVLGELIHLWGAGRGEPLGPPRHL